MGLAQDAPAAEQGSAGNWFPMSGSEENLGQVRLTEKERIELHEDFEDSDHDYSEIPSLESCSSMESITNLGDDSLHPEIQFQSRTPITDDRSCTGHVSRYVYVVHVEGQDWYLLYSKC